MGNDLDRWMLVLLSGQSLNTYCGDLELIDYSCMMDPLVNASNTPPYMLISSHHSSAIKHVLPMRGQENRGCLETLGCLDRLL